ncbi:hypothetical protein SAMN05444920_12629 [Nonomuraea solani]|uniref:Uncharacterized protein n=1 Tax=Nonomuraea solani TaxID=1144553 RepID=A0A1H6EZ52_9ACTN|nr:hypothetical protein SAMN05444920_12629 [Nonomuraea solani]
MQVGGGDAGFGVDRLQLLQQLFFGDVVAGLDLARDAVAELPEYDRTIFVRFDAEAVLSEPYVRVYEGVHADPSYEANPLFSRNAYLDRASAQARHPGFVVVSAEEGPKLVGYTYGFTMEAGRWWRGARRCRSSGDGEHDLSGGTAGLAELVSLGRLLERQDGVDLDAQPPCLDELGDRRHRGVVRLDEDGARPDVALAGLPKEALVRIRCELDKGATVPQRPQERTP